MRTPLGHVPPKVCELLVYSSLTKLKTLLQRLCPLVTNVNCSLFYVSDIWSFILQPSLLLSRRSWLSYRSFVLPILKSIITSNVAALLIQTLDNNNNNSEISRLTFWFVFMKKKKESICLFSFSILAKIIMYTYKGKKLHTNLTPNCGTMISLLEGTGT